MTSPALQLRTLYVLDDAGRLVSTREPGSRRPPVVSLIRSADATAWAIRNDVAIDLAGELARLLASEPPSDDLQAPPVHLERYVELVGGRLESGPAFAFPDAIDAPDGVTLIGDGEHLEPSFADLLPELDGRSPVLAVVEAGHAVSACFCARKADEAAEAGLNTLEQHRGRGFAALVTAAWALAIRESRRVPLYSTAWTNESSRAVARKLGLVAYASDWNISNEEGR